MKASLIAFLALGLLLCAGCVTPAETVEKEEIGEGIGGTSETTPSGPIRVSGDENLSTVKIMASMKGADWKFPIEDHEDEFIKIGLHSDSFIKLNNSQIKFLDDEEAIWLYPMIENDNKAVLFIAIYSREITDCGAGTVKILGKDYDVQQLGNGTSFESDVKWKVGLEMGDSCIDRILIYLDGYYSGMREDQQISLFRNDNTVIFKFSDLGSEPYVEVIGTKPVE